MNLLALIIADLFLIAGTILLIKDSRREREDRAVKIGIAGLAFHLALLWLILNVPITQLIATVYFGAIGLGLLVFLIPGGKNERALKGSKGYIVGNIQKVDERDIVFARNKLRPGSKEYDTYYEVHPERKELDDTLRATGVLNTTAGIDRSAHNLAMMRASFVIPTFLGQRAIAEPMEGQEKKDMSPDEAANIIKEFAKHLGATDVGICKVNPNWVYSKRGEIHFGNWEDWGTDIPDLPEYAVVFTTEMNYDHVIAAPHTPAVAESANRYAEGAYISTVLAQWFKNMGYKGVAEHLRHYDIITPVLAVDAGLGEVGRQGYVISPGEGPRIRVFATLTDMPLAVDKPISFGVEEYCTYCKKCATTCPSKSIPDGDMTVYNGVEKWKLHAESCYQYWSQVGTDCAICMAVCGFARPNTLMHNTVRWFIAHSPVARRFFPIMDDLLYGRDWRPKGVPDWLRY